MSTPNTCPQLPRCERIFAIGEEIDILNTINVSANVMIASMVFSRTIPLVKQLSTDLERAPAEGSRCLPCPLNPQQVQPPTA
jgi:hypothetical protein